MVKDGEEPIRMSQTFYNKINDDTALANGLSTSSQLVSPQPEQPYIPTAVGKF